jgi:integrase
MPRAKTGTYWRHGDHYDVRVTMPDGKRPVIHLEHVHDEETARTSAARLATEAAAGRLVPKSKAGPSETFSEWFKRWTTDRTARGIVSAELDAGRVKKWVDFGDTPIRDITKADLEKFVERLDRAAAAYAEAERTNAKRDLSVMTSWKAAINLWGIVTNAFTDAHNSKTLGLRVLEANPARDVRGPDRGVKKARQHLTPAQLLAFVQEGAVPPVWRRAVALAVYLYPRAAELRGLRWEDVHLGEGYVLLHRTEDEHG